MGRGVMAISAHRVNIRNDDIADTFEVLADLLQIENANPYRIRAYRNAAHYIRDEQRSMSSLVAAKEDLSLLPSIGHDIAEKIKVLVATGELPLLNEVKKRIPPTLRDLLKIEGLGAKRVKLLHDALHVDTLDDLRRVLRNGKLALLPGFGEKTQAKIAASLQQWQTTSERTTYRRAMAIVNPLLTYLKSTPGVDSVDVAGSYRRCRDTVGDLDILVCAPRNNTVTDRFVAYGDVDEVVSKGKTRSTVKLHSGIQVDLRCIPRESRGAALLYLTGSKAHSIALRARALHAGLKINEYGAFKRNHCVASESEADMYSVLGMDYIPPELRENRGEIDAAINHTLPRLIELKNIRGDLHVHTEASDGSATIEQLVEAARRLGYEYLSITDHSEHLRVAHGLTANQLRQQMAAVDKLNAAGGGVTLLKSVEVDILEDGRLDLPADVLRELDFTVCAVHSKFNLSRTKQTERIIRAMDNPYFSILAHPTGRLLNQRQPYDVDMRKIITAARERGCILEINAQPDRMDLNDEDCLLAKKAGVKLAISTDAHSVNDLNNMYLGINQARRGWLEPRDVINTRSLQQLRTLLQRR